MVTKTNLPFDPEHPGPQALPGAEFRLSELLISPEQTIPGAPVTVSVTVSNVGSQPGNKTVVCEVDTTTSQQTVYLNPGESKELTFTFTPTESRNYSVSVDGLSGILNAMLLPVKAKIMNINWQQKDYPYTGDWGEELKATFCKARMEVASDAQFDGTVPIRCPYTIAPVPLLTNYAYERLLAEIDHMIATSGGTVRTLWINRKQIALNFPQADGFRIDYRWIATVEQQQAVFRGWLNAPSVAEYNLEDVFIPGGQNNIDIGFFMKKGAALGINPTVVSLYMCNALVDTIVTNVAPPTGVPQFLGANIPEATPGGFITPSVTMRIPDILEGHQLYFFELKVDTSQLGEQYRTLIARAGYASAVVANPLCQRCGFCMYIPLSSSDGTYQMTGIWDKGTWKSARAVYFHRGTQYPLPPGN